MPIFNITVTCTTTIVVVADDEAHAWQVARENAKQAFENEDEPVQVNIRGEVTSLQHLRNGWDGDSVPYGGNGNQRLSELLPKD